MRRFIGLGLRAGSATVKASYSKLEWDSNKADIWGNITGDYVVKHKTESWHITVLEEGASGSEGNGKNWIDPVECECKGYGAGINCAAWI